MCEGVRICFIVNKGLLRSVRIAAAIFIIAATAGNIYSRCEDRHFTANK